MGTFIGKFFKFIFFILFVCMEYVFVFLTEICKYMRKWTE